VLDDKQIEICEIWAVGERADAEVYAEASRRVAAVASQQPEFHKLADVVERLGRLAHDISAPQAEVREPVPEWLAQRLICTVGLSPEQVAALGLQEAVDLWCEFMTKPKD
jgi:mRNA interferase RelE/StbE